MSSGTSSYLFFFLVLICMLIGSCFIVQGNELSDRAVQGPRLENGRFYSKLIGPLMEDGRFFSKIGVGNYGLWSRDT